MVEPFVQREREKHQSEGDTENDQAKGVNLAPPRSPELQPSLSLLRLGSTCIRGSRDGYGSYLLGLNVSPEQDYERRSHDYGHDDLYCGNVSDIERRPVVETYGEHSVTPSPTVFTEPFDYVAPTGESASFRLH